MIPDQLHPLVSHLVQSTLFASMAGLLALILRRNRAQIRYCLWLAASIKFCIPFSLLVAAGNHLAWRTTPKAAPLVASHPVAEIAQSVLISVFPTAAPAPTPSGPDTLWAVCCAIWAIGFAIVAFSWWRRWRQMRGALRAAKPLSVLDEIQVVSSPAFIEPGVFGIRRPVLLMPDGVVDQLTAPQLEAILAHELCHIRRSDNLAAAIHMVVEALFWFYPVVWWLGARLMQERERACDEEVLHLGNAPEVYAEGILRICELYLKSPLPCVAGVTGANLKKRVEQIMSNRIAHALNGRKKLLLAGAGVVAVSVPILVGTMNASTPRFDVASIKLCNDVPGNKWGAGAAYSPGRMNTGCLPLAAEDSTGLIQRAYVRFADGRAHKFGLLHITGGPEWVHSDLYSIEATAAGKPAIELMQGPMLQALLEERFALRIHRGVRPSPVYALTLADGASRLKPFVQGDCVPTPAMPPLPELQPGQRYCRSIITRGPGVDAEGASLGEFAQLLSVFLDRPVIDKSGLTGRFNIHLEFSADDATPGMPPAPDPNRPPIFTAIHDQLGLRLQAATGPVESIVIDHVERPSAN
ncbi:MAG TPA: M56 family metallopeptidase [Bryobacteraceae bacterium]